MATTLASLLSDSDPMPIISTTTPASSSSASTTTVPTTGGRGGGLNDVVDDCSDDACSICLDPFSSHNPSTMTGCNHEYHLQCILEWSQRSRDCPICSQLIVLKDPASQELLAAVETEKLVRTRNTVSAASSTVPHYLGDFDVEPDSPSDDSDLDEHIMQHIALAASRARYIHRRGREGDSIHVPSQVLAFSSPQNVSTNTQTYSMPEGHGTPPLVGGNSPTSGTSIEFRSATSSVGNGDSLFKYRILFRQPTNDAPEGPDSPEMSSISDTIKSKWLSASARCKESITKGTRGLKEKLNNTSVKELSKGVQREFSAGIAGVTRMIERLDLNVKRTGSSTSVSGFTSETSTISFRGKGVEDDTAHVREMQNEEVAHDIVQRGH